MKNKDFRDAHITDDTIFDLLMPKASPRVPDSIRSNVLSQIRRRDALKNFFTMKNRVSKIVASAAAVAAVVAVIIVGVRPTTARAANVAAILDRSIDAANEVRTMVMKIDVRTEPFENFAYTDPLLPMVEHTLTFVRGERPVWRLEKGLRTVLFDGEFKYLWIDGFMGFKGTASTNFEEWFDILLDPAMVPMREKSAQRDGVRFFVEETGDEIILSANVRAQGDFTNDYLRNTSIAESDTRRELVFDRATGLLKSLKIFAKIAGINVLIVDVKSIDYDVAVDESSLVALPEGYEWRDVTITPEAGKFAGISASEAASLIADAINAGDIESVSETFANYDISFIGKHFEGAEIIRQSEPFRSGMYPGVFVRYKMRLPDGKIEKWNIALRNDNPGGVWLVDGGI